MSTGHDITVMGRTLRIRSDEEPEHVQAVATYVNEKIETLSADLSSATQQQVLLMTTLTLADELFKLRAQQAAMADKIRDTSRTLLNRLA